MSVAERIAALQKNADRSTNATRGKGASEGVVGGGGGNKVSSLAGDLSARLNMNAMLGGAPPPGGIGGGIRPRGPSGSATCSASKSSSDATSERLVKFQQQVASNRDEGSKDGTKLQHVARTIIPPGRRKRKGIHVQQS